MKKFKKLNTTHFSEITKDEEGIVSGISLLDKPESVISITDDENDTYTFRINYINNDEPYYLYKNKSSDIVYKIGKNSKRIYNILINDIYNINIKNIKNDIIDITKKYKPDPYSRALIATFNDVFLSVKAPELA